MPLYLLDDKMWFPSVNDALPDGLLAVGGDLSMERLLLAYRSGIFPWYNEEDPPMWWSPDPRCVLWPAELKVSRSMQALIKKNEFRFSINSAFQQVIESCRTVTRRGMDGTWINHDIINAYTQLHKMGYGYSAEAWKDGELAGGLYGLKIGRMFFGESMFSRVTNASKYALIKMVEYLRSQGVVLIDCQVYNDHLASLGATMMPRTEFIELLAANIG